MDKNLICKLLTPHGLNLGLNNKLSNYTAISELFLQNNVRFHPFFASFTIEEVELSFTKSCKFQDIYLLAYVLNDYGLKKIYPLIDSKQSILVGSFFHTLKNCPFKPITISEFLKIDPRHQSQYVFNRYFPETFAKNIKEDIELKINEEEEEEDFEYREPEGSRKNMRHYNDDLDMDQQGIDFWNQF